MRKYSSTLPVFELDDTLNSGATSATLTNGSSLPVIESPEVMTLVFEPDTANEEIVTVTAHASGSNTITIVRGQEGTSDVTHTAGTFAKHMVTARDLQEPHKHIVSKNYSENGSVELHGLASSDGDVVGTAKSQTLTNKIISGATNDLSNIPQSSVTGLVSALSGKASTTHSHVISDVTDLQTSLDAKAPLASPALTGTPTAPTATLGTDTTQIATTAFVQDAVDLKASLASPTFTGTVSLPLASSSQAAMQIKGTNSTTLVTPTSTSNANGIYTTFVAPPSGKVVIHHHAYFNVTSTSGGAASVYVRLYNSPYTELSDCDSTDERGYIASQKGADAGSGNAAMSGVVYLTGLTAGTTYIVYQQYKATDSTGVEISKRELAVIPSL